MKGLNHFVCIFKLQIIRGSGPFMFFVFIQAFMALGIVIGFTYMYATPDKTSILYLATGAPTFILIMTGLVLLPQQIGDSKIDGFMEFKRTWPVKRYLLLLADTVIWLIITVPALVISTLVAKAIFNPGYSFSLLVIPGFLLCALTSIGVGYGFSYLFSKDQGLMISQIVAFGSLMFSPLNFPIDRLAGWLQSVHRVLPIYSMAQVMRSSFAATTFAAEPWNYANLAIWCVLGYGGAMFILNKKQ